MSIKISKKIKGFSVQSGDDKQKAADAVAVAKAAELPRAEVIQMHEQIERPEVLVGSTYKTNRGVRSRSSSTRRTWITSSGW